MLAASDTACADRAQVQQVPGQMRLVQAKERLLQRGPQASLKVKGHSDSRTTAAMDGQPCYQHQTSSTMPATRPTPSLAAPIVRL